jgi:hypothetical protein
MKYVKVGEKVDYNGTILLVAISKDDKPICSGCFFSDRYRGRVGLARISCCVHGLACTARNRKDKHHVVFIKQ